MPLIDIPLTPRFLLESARSTFPVGGYEKEHSYSQSDIDNFFNDFEKKENQENDKYFDDDKFKSEFAKDYDRSPWFVEVMTDDGPWIKEARPRGTQGLQNLSTEGKNPINLTQEEARTVYIFGNASAGKFFQGGITRGFYGTIASQWMTQNNYQVPSQQEDIASHQLVKRDNSNLLIETVQSSNKLIRVSPEENKVSDQPLLEAKYNVRIESDNGINKGEIDKENYTYKIDEAIWKTDILPKAFVDLSELKTINQFDLFRFIPCLIDPKFTKAFAKKLAEVGDEAIIQLANNWIGLSFENRPKDLSRIAREFEKNKVSDHLRPLALLKEETDDYQKYLEKTIMSELKELKKELMDSKLVHSYELWREDEQSNVEKIEILLNNKFNFKAVDQFFTNNKQSIPKSDTRDRLEYAIEKYKAVQEIKQASFEVGSSSNKDRLDNFAKTLSKNAEAFTKTADPRTEKFISVVKKVLCAIPGVNLLVAPILIAHSVATKNSWQFWKTRDELFQEKAKESSNPTPPTTPRKK